MDTCVSGSRESPPSSALDPEPLDNLQLNQVLQVLPISKLREVFKECLGWNRQGLCQLYDVFQRHVALTTLDTANIISMKTRYLTESLLRETTLFSQRSDGASETSSDGNFSHSIIFFL
jgi:hypothetical protein